MGLRNKCEYPAFRNVKRYFVKNLTLKETSNGVTSDNAIKMIIHHTESVIVTLHQMHRIDLPDCFWSEFEAGIRHSENKNVT